VSVVGDRIDVLDRRRVTLVEDDASRFAYHSAADLPIVQARAFIRRVEKLVAKGSATAIKEIVGLTDVDVVAAAVVGEPRDLPELAAVLKVHAKLHACEGELFRRGLAEAAADAGLDVLRVGPKAVAEVVGESELARLKAVLGPPWTKDHREAVAAAVLALTDA
jgi:hypothetical protein